MRTSLRLAFAVTALLPGVSVARGQGRPITGDYSLAGTTVGGPKYAGSATISKIGGEMYRAKWTIATRVFSGVCFRERESLACSSCPSPEVPTVVSYLAGPKGLDGVHFSAANTRVGKEILTPKGQREATKDVTGNPGQMNPVTLVGTFDVKGTNPDKSTYAGTASVRQIVAVSPYAYEFDWTLGASRMQGVGTRSIAGSPIVAAQCSKKTATVALVYAIDIKGRILTGSWTEDAAGTVTAGTETMTKR